MGVVAVEADHDAFADPAAASATCATTSGSTLDPSIIVIRLDIGCASIAARLWARMSMSMPTTRASCGPPQAAFSSSSDGHRISDPPWAIPVSTMRSGWTRPDQLLHRDDVLRVLDDRSAQPREVVRVLRRDRLAHERLRRLAERTVPSVGGDPLLDFSRRTGSSVSLQTAIRAWTDRPRRPSARTRDTGSARGSVGSTSRALATTRLDELANGNRAARADVHDPVVPAIQG